MSLRLYLCAIVALYSLFSANAAINKPFLDPRLSRFEWILGIWETDKHDPGVVIWPTIPTMNYREVVEFWPAEVSDATGNTLFVNYSAIAISHNSGDHFHNEYGMLTILPSGEVNMFAIGNNGFATHEKGQIFRGGLDMESVSVDRLTIARELPTEFIRREFRAIPTGRMEQVIWMRTETHPKDNRPFQEHARNRYVHVQKWGETSRRPAIYDPYYQQFNG